MIHIINGPNLYLAHKHINTFKKNLPTDMEIEHFNVSGRLSVSTSCKILTDLFVHLNNCIQLGSKICAFLVFEKPLLIDGEIDPLLLNVLKSAQNVCDDDRQLFMYVTNPHNDPITIFEGVVPLDSIPHVPHLTSISDFNSSIDLGLSERNIVFASSEEKFSFINKLKVNSIRKLGPNKELLKDPLHSYRINGFAFDEFIITEYLDKLIRRNASAPITQDFIDQLFPPEILTMSAYDITKLLLSATSIDELEHFSNKTLAKLNDDEFLRFFNYFKSSLLEFHDAVMFKKEPTPKSYPFFNSNSYCLSTEVLINTLNNFYSDLVPKASIPAPLLFTRMLGVNYYFKRTKN